MSNNTNYKQVANVERRTWDVESYEKKAAARLEQQLQPPSTDRTTDDNKRKTLSDDTKEEFRAAPSNAAGPEGSQRAYLQARKHKVSDIDERVGSSTIVSVEGAATSSSSSTSTSITDGVTKTGIGWHCTVCDCYLKDSLTYLDHINGRKHQRKLGFTMRVERATESDVLSKLNALKQQKQKEEFGKDTIKSYDQLVKEKDEQERIRKEERQRQRKERRKLQKSKERGGHQQPEQEDNNDDTDENPIQTKNTSNRAATAADDAPEEEEVEEEETEGVDPAMAAMMGFSGFGGGGKNR